MTRKRGSHMGGSPEVVFTGSDEELARRLQQEELCATAARTRNRARKLPDLLTLETCLPLSPSASAHADVLPTVVSTPAKQEPIPDGPMPIEIAPSHSPSSRLDTITILGAPSVPSSATPASRKRRAADAHVEAALSLPPRKRYIAATTTQHDEHDQDHASDKSEGEKDCHEGDHSAQPGAVESPVVEAVSQAGRDCQNEDAKEEPGGTGVHESNAGHAPRSSRNRRKKAMPEAAPTGASPSVSSGDLGHRGLDGQHNATQQQDAAKAAPKRRRSRGGPRKLPKLPMVRHMELWYRARTLHDDGAHITLELTGFQGLGSVIVLPVDSDRLWRGSYKGKDWKHVGDGAWVPKVPQHRNGGRGKAKGCHGKSHSHGQASGHTSGQTNSGHMSGLDSDGHGQETSDDDDDMGEDSLDRLHKQHSDDKLDAGDDLVHPYGSVGDQNWPGDGTMKTENAGPSGLTAPSPRRRKSIHKPTRAPMGGEAPPCAPSNPLQVTANPPQLPSDAGPHSAVPPIGPCAVGMMGRQLTIGGGFGAYIPCTPPMTPGMLVSDHADLGEDTGCTVADGAGIDGPPHADAQPMGSEGAVATHCDEPVLDATEVELEAAEAMMSCMAECTLHALKEASPTLPSSIAGEEDEEAAAAAALLGQSALRHQSVDTGAAVSGGMMLTPRRPGGPRGGRGRKGAGIAGRRLKAVTSPSAPHGRGLVVPMHGCKTGLKAFSTLLGALGDLERPAVFPASMLAKQRLNRVLALPLDALLLPVPVGMQLPPMLPPQTPVMHSMPSVPLFAPHSCC